MFRFTLDMENEKNAALTESNHEWDSCMTLSAKVYQDLDWWLLNLDGQFNYITQPKVDVVIKQMHPVSMVGEVLVKCWD